MKCKKCKYCQTTKTLSGNKYWCIKMNKKATNKYVCLGFKEK